MYSSIIFHVNQIVLVRRPSGVRRLDDFFRRPSPLYPPPGGPPGFLWNPGRRRPEPPGASQNQFLKQFGNFFDHFDVILGHVLAVKPHISIQNMIWDHPHGGKTHEESFVDTLRPPKHRF